MDISKLKVPILQLDYDEEDIKLTGLFYKNEHFLQEY